MECGKTDKRRVKSKLKRDKNQVPGSKCGWHD